MQQENLEFEDENAFELDETRQFYAVVVAALADRVSSFAAGFAAKGLDSDGIRTLGLEITTLQMATSRALTRLNNAVVAEYDGRRS